MEPTLTTPTGSLIPATADDRGMFPPRPALRNIVKPFLVLGACAALFGVQAGAQAQEVSGAMSGVVASMSMNQAPHDQHAAKPVDPAERQRLQARISRAETNFQLGLDQYRAAAPCKGPATIPGRDHLRQAKAYFLLAKDDLEQALNGFGDDLEGEAAERRLDAVALREYNQRLLVSVERADLP